MNLGKYLKIIREKWRFRKKSRVKENLYSYIHTGGSWKSAFKFENHYYREKYFSFFLTSKTFEIYFNGSLFFVKNCHFGSLLGLYFSKKWVSIGSLFLQFGSLWIVGSNVRGRQIQALPTSCWRYIILFHIYLSIKNILHFIPSLSLRESMIHT